ncbi:heterogeneous nuclear ribonucleoprotein L-like [Acropora muricata]|uniref:LOW QUALITY PROTEIN: heterogeneous nuclear ribonucleoprotein L-like n=1 Tax=Acropora millepora TaxID=45264 RepID=UPI0010FCAB55|nr:LOW QUALITY PROTEIN: heterogeneous nuclear ribonucleoprotein L-like [Acropora millepora]
MMADNIVGKHSLDAESGYDEYGNGDLKRMKVESGTSGGPGNPHYQQPSPVIHVRGVADEAREQDLLHSLSTFGPVSCITMMPKMRQALVEFEDIESAKAVMEYTEGGSGEKNLIVLCGRPCYFNYSKSKAISKNLNVPIENPPSRILLICIINPQYPVTTDILYTIFSKQGHVLKIVIFRKSGLQAMVEFATVEQAMQAKDTLNGADIYTGCNTLKIEFSKADSLNVYRNDENTFDYTQPDKPPGPGPVRPPVKEGLLSPPPRRPFPPRRGGMRMQAPRPFLPPRPPAMEGAHVIMVYGLHESKMNCDRLFNVLCCYGNVLKIKFLLNKPGTAMVEMSDHVACNTIIQCLGKQKLFDKQLDVSFSKQKYLVHPTSVSNLDDGTPCFKDFSESKNHRFWTEQQSNKNRIFSPTKVLHFFNAPPDFSEEKVHEMCSFCGVEPPPRVKIFPNATRSASGLLEWNDPFQALDAIAACNHYVIRDPAARTIFTVKLAFSSMSST